MEMIKQDIVIGKLKIGERMPSSRDLSVRLGINFNTVARAYKELETEGILFTRRGLGTFTTESPEIIDLLRYEMAQKQIDSFIKGMTQIGYTKEDMIKFIENEEIYNERNE